MTTNEKEPKRIIFSIGTREQAVMCFAEAMELIGVLQETIEDCLEQAKNGKQIETIEGLDLILVALGLFPDRLAKIVPTVSEEELDSILAEQPNAPAGNC